MRQGRGDSGLREFESEPQSTQTTEQKIKDRIQKHRVCISNTPHYTQLNTIQHYALHDLKQRPQTHSVTDKTWESFLTSGKRASWAFISLWRKKNKSEKKSLTTRYTYWRTIWHIDSHTDCLTLSLSNPLTYRMARPVWCTSIFARRGMFRRKLAATLFSTSARCRTSARDQTPDSKVEWAMCTIVYYIRMMCQYI